MALEDDEDQLAEPTLDEPAEAAAPLESLIAKAARAAPAGSLDEQFAALARAQRNAMGGRAAGAGAAELPTPGPTWAEVTARPDYQQASTERRKQVRSAWMAGEAKYADRAFKKKTDREAYMGGVTDAVPSLKEPTRSTSETLGDLLIAFKSGVRGAGGAVGGALSPVELYAGEATDLGNFFNAAAADDASKQYKKGLSAATKDAQRASQEREDAAEAGFGKIKAVAGAIKDYPMLGAMVMTETAPSILATVIPGVGVARGAALALKAIGVAEQAAAKWATQAGLAASMSSGAVQGAGQARNQVVQQLMEAKDDQWETDDEYVLLRDRVGADAAKRAIAEQRSILPGVIGATIAGLSGRIGLEKVLIGGAGKGIRARLGAAAAEETGEVGEETAVKILANLEEQRLAPGTSAFKGVERTAVETVVGAAPGAGVAALAPRAGAKEPAAATELGAGPAAPETPPAEPPGPPPPPASFREDVARRVTALDERIAAAQEDAGLTGEQRDEVVRGVEAERAGWLKAREESENTAPVVEARAEVERLEREIAEVEARPVDEDTKAKQIGARTTRAEELKSLIALNELSESELEQYAAARREAIQDADAQRGLGARGIDTPRLEREANFADRVLMERALVETPTETAFAARARTKFKLDDSGNPEYPTPAEVDNKDPRAGLDLAADVAQALIWQPRNNKAYTRGEKSALIRQARETALRLDRAREIMDAPAERIPQIREQLVQAMIDVGRRKGNFDQGRVTELAAVIAREADARGEKITLGQAKERALTEIQRLLIEEGPTGPPPPGASPPAPAPGADPGPGGKDVGYDVVGGWLVYTGVRVGPYGRAPDKTQRNAIVEALRKAFSIPDGLVAGVVQALNVRWLQNTDPGAYGWYMPSRNQPWLHGFITTDTTGKKTENDVVHTTTHESGHAIDDVRRNARYLSEESGALAAGTALRKELEAADAKAVAKTGGLDFGYPLRWGVGGRENLRQIELFAQIIGYYHSARQDLAKEAPLAYALAKEIVDGLNQLAASGRPGQQPIADVVSGALANVGNAPGAAAPPTGPAGPTPAGVSPGPGGAGAGVAAAVREPRAEREAELLAKGVDDGAAVLAKQNTFLGAEAARDANVATVTEAIDIAQREAAAASARPEGAPARAEARRPEAAARADREAAARPGTPAPREGAVVPAARRAPEAAAPGRPVEGAADEAVSESRTESVLPGTPASTPVAVRDTLARMFGIRPESVRRLLKKIDIVLDADIKSGKLMTMDGTTLSGIGATSLAAYDPKTNTIFIIADRVPKGWERAVLMHELFHKRGGQFLGSKQIQRMRDEFRTWRVAPKGSPERTIYDAALPRAQAAIRLRVDDAKAKGKALSAQQMQDVFDEEILPYAIEEGVKLGLNVDPKQILAKGAKGWFARVGQWFRDEIARLTGKPPKEFDARDLMVAAWGAAQLELTDATAISPERRKLAGIGQARARAALFAREAFSERRSEARRGEFTYTPEVTEPKGRTTAMRPSEIATATAPTMTNAQTAGEVYKGPTLAKDLGTSPKKRVDARRRLERIYEEGNTRAEFTPDTAIAIEDLIDDMTAAAQKPVPDRVRGADYLRERLLRAQRQGVMSPEQTALALWLLDRNPNVANDLGISIRQQQPRDKQDAAAFYNPAARIAVLFADSANPDTASHEILHHTERMMPAPVREGIRKEWWRQLNDRINELRQLEDPTREQTNERIALQMLAQAHVAGNPKGLEIFEQLLQAKAIPMSAYQYYNPSEFWAVNGSTLLRGRAEAEGAGWIAQARQWLAELIDKAKSVFGLSSRAPVIRALNAVLEGDGSFLSQTLLQTPEPGAVNVLPMVAPRSGLAKQITGVYASPAQAAAANAQAPAPGPNQPNKSIYEIYSPKTAAPIKTRKQLSTFIATKNQPTTEWAPQARDQFIENWQDYQRPFYSWLRDNVLTLEPWKQLKLIPGKLKAMTDRFTRAIADPLAKDINAFAQKYKIDTSTASDVIGYWAMFRHIPEANAALRDKIRARLVAGERGAAEALRAHDETQRGAHPDDDDPKRARMAGGLTDAEAVANREELERSYDVADLKSTGDKIVAGFATMKEEAIKSGQISQEALKRFPKFQHYVALTGLPWDDTANDGFGTYVAPNLLREREGRQDTVADQSVKALMDRIGRVSAYSSSVDFKKSLNDIYDAQGGKDNKIGLTRMESHTAQTPAHADIIYQEKDGKRYIFRFDNEKIGEALLAKNKEYADNAALRLMDRATRVFSRAYTTWTASFGPVNVWRDVWEKAILIRSRNVRDRVGNLLSPDSLFARTFANAFMMDTWRAAKQLAFDGEADESTLAGRLANELRDRGGISTLAQKLATGREEIAKEARKHAGFRKGMDTIVGVVEKYNMMLEVVSTLSAHAAMRDLNVDPNEAAFQALDLMNFQNQGAKTRWLRAMFAFFNPAVQSGTNLWRQLGTKRGQRDAMIGLALLSVLYTISRATGDDDEELGNEMDYRGSYEQERNVTFKLGGTIYKIAVPFGLPQLLWATIVNTGRYASGRYDAQSAVAQQATSFIKTFSPVPPSEVEFTKQPVNFFFKSITPSVFKGAIDMVTDTNAWGQKLTAYYPQPGKFESEQGRANTPKLYKDLAQEIRATTGWDLYPEQWRALLEGVAWGPAGYMLKSLAESNAEAEGRKKDPLDEVPLSSLARLLGASRFVGGQSRYVEAAYYDTYGKASTDLKALNAAKAREADREWRQDNPEKARRADALVKQRNAMLALTKDYNSIVKAMQADKIDTETGRERLGLLQDKKEALMREFLRSNKRQEGDF